MKYQCKLTNDVFLMNRLAAIKSTEAENTLADILVVQDFDDVFFNISGLPPKRDRLLYGVSTQNITDL